MSIICCRMPGHRKRDGLANEPLLVGSASGLAAEWHFSVTLCLNEARQVRPQASVSDRRSGTEGVETPRRRPPTILRLGQPPAAIRAPRPIALYRWDLEYLLDISSMALDDRNLVSFSGILGAESRA